MGYHPQRSRRDSVDSLIDDMFRPGSDYDNSRGGSDREPSQPLTLSSTTTCINGTNTTPDTVIVSTDIIVGWESLRTARVAIEKWIQPLGPIDGWAEQIRKGYNVACQGDGNTREAVDKFLASMQEHVNIGRRVLGELNAAQVSFNSAWADWLLAADMLGMLHRGIAILETHVDIWASFPVPSSPMSGIRQLPDVENFLT